MITVADHFNTQRRDCERKAKRLWRILRRIPQEVQDLEVDSAFLWQARRGMGETTKLNLHQESIEPGTLTMLLNLSEDEEAEAKKGWPVGTKFYKFNFGKFGVILRTKAVGCREYRVTDKEPSSRTITVCGELDRSRYSAIEYLGET